MYVLIVEDETQLSGALTRVGIQRGHEIKCTPSAKAAFEEVANRRPDAIVLDIGLNGSLDGRDVLSRLREAAIPTFVHSATTDLFVIAVCWEHGARDVLLKPIPAGEVFARIERALSTIDDAIEPGLRLSAHRPAL